MAQDFSSFVSSLTSIQINSDEPWKGPKPAKGFLNAMTYIGVVFFVCISVSLYFLATLVAYPYLYQNDPDMIWNHRVCFTIVFIELILNWFLCHRVTCYHKNVHQLPMFSPSAGSINQRFCADCDDTIPPRAHHCALCQNCILKRDHHCFFIANCIGFNNQRYFIVFLFYASVGCFYAAYGLINYISLAEAPLSGWGWVRLIFPLPVVQMIIGALPPSKAGLYAATGLAICTAISTGLMFFHQMLLAVLGQTSHELYNRITIYRESIGRNLRSVFGPFWLINFVIPLNCLKNEGDGVQWRTTELKVV